MQRAEQSRSRWPWAVGVILLVGAGAWLWRGQEAAEVASEAIPQVRPQAPAPHPVTG